ncbi:MAG TPA: alpha/beta hydrolase-fold protein [Oscillospiraceae bacterium]|nr:alpha/beta hydrolase-fold protein [Oscillospiraceae bacterium]HPF55263.1 alpha/beta hydrolase-fold protein [Clostridiales bacterium]HPK36011.1 alpha/beta hydrolase-fold protein [Oscillospiraceae bacterium]
MKKKIYMADEKCRMNFEVFTPEPFKKNLPLIVYLHGAGERGTVIEHLSRHGIPLMLENGYETEAVILCPQCPGDCVWDNIPHEVKAVIDRVIAEYDVDHTRVSLTGSSMGGFGTWMIGLTFPNFFSAIAPVAGGGMSWRCSNLSTTPVHAYHGGADTGVPLVYSQLMVDSVVKNGGSAELTVLDGYGHCDGINTAYQQYGIIDWLLSHKRTDFSPIPEALSVYY